MPIVEKNSLQEYISWLNQIASKWRRIWSEKRVYEANPSNKPKFYLTAAFPYPNGPMHLGHARTYTLTDVYARYKRMKGYNVLFPMGFHYTGTPVLAMADSVKEGDEKTLKLFKEVYRIPDDVIEKMKDPMYMARYFHSKIKEAMETMGYCIDWRREFTSIDPLFSSFITWQFTKLYEKGYITKGTHPVGWDPVVQTPVGMHDTKGDVEPEIEEFTLLFFTLDDGTVLPAATLRPETVFGAVNVWVNPEAVYVEALVDGRKWIVSREAVEKLRHQLKNVRVVRELRGSELVGERVRNPATGWRVPVLPAGFVDPDTATGIVMSVPAHAPYDYAALRDILRDKEFLEKIGVEPSELKPLTVVEIPGVSRQYAVDIVEKMGIETQFDREALEKATREVYSMEFKRGRVVEEIVDRIATDIPGKTARNYLKAAVKALIAGKPVPEAREATAEWLIGAGYGDKMYEIINKPVYSRWGNKVIVKVLENQWFIDYGISEWKKLVREALDSMRIVPETVRREFIETIEWVKKRACARTRGLGTRLPWDNEWVIESLSDSTVYMAFYTVVHILRKHGVKPDSMKPIAWDYIMLGKGDPKRISRETGIPIEALEEARKEFDYWYPLDSRHSAKDLVPNHLTFFIFNHVALFPKNKWPRQIVVNGYVLYHGQKMSKSLFNVIPVHILTQQLSPDGLRLAISIASEIDQDLDFREEQALSVIEQLRRIHTMIKEHLEIIRKYRNSPLPEKLELEDYWILSKTIELLDKTGEALENVRVREAATNVYYMFEEYVKKYIDMLKSRDRYIDENAAIILAHVFDAWIKLMSIYTPFFAEEMWSMIGGGGLVVEQEWPIIDRDYYRPYALLAVEFIGRLVSDIREIVRVKKMAPKKITVYVVGRDGYEALHRAIEYVRESRSMKEFIRDMVVEEVDKKTASRRARQLYELASSLPPYIKDLVVETMLDEKEVIEALRKWVEKQVGAPIEVYRISEKQPPTKKPCLPLKPAIYIEF